MQFDGSSGGEAVLIARWGVLSDNGRRLLTTKKTRISQHWTNQDYEALVQAMSQNLMEFSREIAETIKALPPKRDHGS